MKRLTIRKKLDVILQYGTLRKVRNMYIYNYWDDVDFGFTSARNENLDKLINCIFLNINENTKK